MSQNLASSYAESDLPGFYFDPARRRYFRIEPGHNNYNPITFQSIKEKEVEEKRQKVLKTDNFSKDETTSYLRSIFSNRLEKFNKNVMCLNLNNHIGNLAAKSFTTLVHKSCLGLLSPSDKLTRKMESPYLDIYGLCELYKIAVSPDDKKLAVAFNNPLLFSYYDLSPENWLSLENPGIDIFAWARGIWISQLHFLNVSDSAFRPSYVVYAWTTKSCLTTNLSLWDFTTQTRDKLYWSTSVSVRAFIQSLTGAWREGRPLVTAAWESTMKNPVDIYDVVNNKKWKVEALKGRSVFTQLFSSNGKLLFHGLKDGRIICTNTLDDLRQPLFSLRKFRDAESCLSCMKLLSDENYLLSGDIDGRLLLWDLRMRKAVHPIYGHKNDHHCYPFHVNEEANIIYAAGKDGYTRVWDLKDGKSLYELPAPAPVISHLQVPQVLYSTHWGGTSGNAGFLFAMNVDNFPVVYSYLVRPDSIANQ